MAAAKSLEMRTTPPAKQNPATNPEDIDLEVYRAAITLFSMRAAEEYVILDKSSVGTAMADPNLLSMQEDKRIRNDASLGSKNFGAFMAATTHSTRTSSTQPIHVFQSSPGFWLKSRCQIFAVAHFPRRHVASLHNTSVIARAESDS
ncbi:hypothetical protein SNOG_16242 [Parastagonospora nodorum SN15]|uniref:Uncharacterized protein n=1 Tax=Phaeosphaeria nodorum (strain SN15 / ATCC MYA-4574 / FGSC 10173) TaxID=321614 RepID=Q0TWC8_PHANO|nr:hypothetical protein SNOG_16242 [Parastagonospora nodorum SN15]EAT76426.2 hypothetical protein SNOG_16242 [Parastagonospora nodorum SN15]